MTLPTGRTGSLALRRSSEVTEFFVETIVSKTGNESDIAAGHTGPEGTPPFVQCILWTPRKLANAMAPATEADLVFSQQALSQAREHAASSPNAPVGGVFLGEVHEDPTCGRKWVRVDRAVRARRLLPEEASAEILGAALAEVIAAGEEREVVGWYRTHARTGVYLSEQEAQLQETHFGEPWQCAMIIAGSAEHPVGGVFQRIEGTGLSRSGYTPFFELIDRSSEFTPGWKRTFIGWSNYQTEVSVALAGKAGVSSVIPPDPSAAPGPSETDSDRTGSGEVEGGVDGVPIVSPESIPPTPSEPVSVHPPEPVSAGPPEPVSDGQAEESWSEVQIRRSLSAVGRTLGPSSASGLGAPTPPRGFEPVKLEDEGAASSARDPASPDIADAASAPPVSASAPEPVRPEPFGSRPLRLEPADTHLSPEATPRLVGGSRRKSRLPVRALALAATGLVAFLGGGWFVVNWVSGAPDPSAGAATPPAVATGELSVTEDPEASVAGLTIGRGPLFPRASDDVEVDDFLWVGPEMPEASMTGDEADVLATGSLDGVREDAVGSGPTGSPVETAPPEIVATETPTPTGAIAIDTSVSLGLEGLRLDDPAVAAFENAFTIFRKETVRYDSLRVMFEDQLEGCNALNLSYRAVNESFGRLGRRFEAARDQFAGPGLQAYRSAQRQIAVIDVHYELSECPLPRGG